jgi:hypothetical protein
MMTYSDMEAKLRRALILWQWGYEVHQVHSSHATGDIWKILQMSFFYGRKTYW